VELAINPSKIISSLCYSVLKLEPYTNCSYACRYCYARWYRTGKLKPRFQVIGIFAKVAKKLDVRIPFRLATLCEPFQDVEERFKISLKLLNVARDYGIPIILSTKSDRIARDPWRGVINSMAKDDLIVVQVSISTLKKTELEPNAPEPIKRLEALSELDAPRVLRLQPLIPNLSFSNAEEFVEFVKDFGIDQITVEPLRVERSEIDAYRAYWDKWTNYSFEGDLVKVDCPEIIRELKYACDKYNIDFGLCKEGYFDLETANCCGMHYIDADIRPTLREVYKELIRVKEIEFDEIKKIFNKYLFGDCLNDLPNPIRKALRYHEKTLLKVLRDEKTIAHLTPLISIRDSKICLAN